MRELYAVAHVARKRLAAQRTLPGGDAMSGVRERPRRRAEIRPSVRRSRFRLDRRVERIARGNEVVARIRGDACVERLTRGRGVACMSRREANGDEQQTHGSDPAAHRSTTKAALRCRLSGRAPALAPRNQRRACRTLRTRLRRAGEGTFRRRARLPSRRRDAAGRAQARPSA